MLDAKQNVSEKDANLLNPDKVSKRMLPKFKTPNFFLVGAPKCGTTSMSVYLSKHPQVCFASPKEPLYFGSDLDHAWRIRSLDAYRGHFSAWAEQTAVGEGTVWYLYSRNAAQEIKAFSPEARIIVMLRNPVDMLHSLFLQFRVTCNESIPRFEDALAAQHRRVAGIDVPPEAHFPGGLQYYAIARYAEQLERYFRAFGRQAVLVILFEDFVANTADVFRRVLEHLNLETSFVPEFTHENASREVLHPRLNRWIRKPPNVISGLSNRIPPGPPRDHLKRIYGNVRSLLLYRLSQHQKRTRPPLAVRQRIIDALGNDIHRLETLLEVDLGHWLTASAATSTGAYDSRPPE
jgi:hypothetical protein